MGVFLWCFGFPKEACKNSIKQRCGDDIWFDLVKGETKVRLLINPVACSPVGCAAGGSSALAYCCCRCSGYW